MASLMPSTGPITPLYRIFLNRLLRVPVSILCILIPFTSLARANEHCLSLFAGDKPAKKQLIQFDSKTYQYSGLTPEGLQALRQARDTIRERARLFRSDLKNLDTVHHAGIVSRLFKGNMFLYGPPGGAKSAFVHWLLTGEIDSPFKLQLHQMITEQALVGGQDFESAKRGQFKIETKGSLADHVTALLDEAQLANPATLMVLQSLLEMNREVLLGNKVIQAKLQTLFATSNFNLAEMIQYFQETGQGPTAPAFLNRFQFKAFVYNWLSPKDQAALDQRVQRKRYLESLAETNPEVLNDQVFVKPGFLNWPELRQLAHSMFELSPLFMTVYRELVNDMRKQTNSAIRESEEAHRQSHLEEPFIYFPSADYTERLRQQIPEIILLSTFVDFLMSPLADDPYLTHITKKPIKLDPVSLWRGFLVMTTLGPGDARLVFNPNGDQKIDIDFSWSIEPSLARDKREERLIQNLIAEQERFKRTFLKHLDAIKDQIELSVRHDLKKTTPEMEETSFEILMLSGSGG